MTPADPEQEVRTCTTCGKSVEGLPYAHWLFHTCRSCNAEPAPNRWSDTGTCRKFRYFPWWHFTEHPKKQHDWESEEIANA